MPTAKDLWAYLGALYSSGHDGLQMFDNLTIKDNSIKQGKDSIEAFYGNLVALWKEIDRRVPNSMKCPKDIIAYNEIT